VLPDFQDADAKADYLETVEICGRFEVWTKRAPSVQGVDSLRMREETVTERAVIFSTQIRHARDDLSRNRNRPAS
jgi:hypothetical protein